MRFFKKRRKKKDQSCWRKPRSFWSHSLINSFSAHDDVEMVYRSCSLESLDSQCGEFRYEGVQYNGCVMSCTEDGCNTTSGLRVNWLTVLFSTTIVFSVIFKQQYSSYLSTNTWIFVSQMFNMKYPSLYKMCMILPTMPHFGCALSFVEAHAVISRVIVSTWLHVHNMIFFWTIFMMIH